MGGYSSGAKGCAKGSATQVSEADACMKKDKTSKGVDTCGCSPSLGEGWSSRRSACAMGSDTDPREACACASKPPLVEEGKEQDLDVQPPPVEEVQAPPVEEVQAPPVDEVQASPVEEVQAPPVEEDCAKRIGNY